MANDELIERLRTRAKVEDSGGGCCNVQMDDVGGMLQEAASEIARLRAESAEKDGLVEAVATAARILQPIADATAKSRNRIDYKYTTSHAGRACLDAYEALSATPAPRTLPEEGSPEWEAMVEQVARLRFQSNVREATAYDPEEHHYEWGEISEAAREGWRRHVHGTLVALGAALTPAPEETNDAE